VRGQHRWLSGAANLRPREALLGLYAAIAITLAAWWFLGQAVLFRLYRTASTAPDSVRQLFREVAGRAGERVVLRTTPRIALPFTFTWWRPIILLPTDFDASELRYALAHEWSHVERRDAWAWNLAALAQVLLFYQPMFWWLRRQLRLCQDFLADARAAEQAQAAEDYAAYLVALARTHRGAGTVLPALSIGGRRSHLYRRVVMLIQDREPLERRCRGTWNLAAMGAALVVIVAAACLRLDAAPPVSPPRDDKPKDSAVAKDAPKAEALDYSGAVFDKETGKPIAGATVTVRRSDSRHDMKVIEETNHTTDAEGKYQFTVPPEQVAIAWLYIELDVEHPEYAPQKRFGYSLAMIRKNEKLGGRPFFEHIDLRPAKAVTGRLETTDGKPVAGVKVMSYSNSERTGNNGFEYGSFAETTSDAEGRFRLMLITPGPAVVWVLPEQYAPSLRGLKDNKRGDLGRFVLADGPRLSGRVFDAQGQPVAGANVNAERDYNADDPEIEFLRQLIVADSINRSAVTDAEGRFTMGPLPPATYRVSPAERSRTDGKRRAMPASVFVASKVTLEQGKPPEALEIRAVPHVVVAIQNVDSKGKPRRGFEAFLNGRLDGTSWWTQGHPDDQGKIVILAPHGLEDARLDSITNEHGAIRVRLQKEGTLSNEHQVAIGTLDHDLKGVEIVHYTAPLVLAKIVDKDGMPILGAQLTGLYPEGKAAYRGAINLSGLRSDVHFEKQEDGRFRSEQLFPDDEVTFTAQAEGYAPKSEKMTLPEGDKKELTFVLEKK
jgi:beta-lactamase regulating signal transducer with metallopeptidase domain/protocatechuate 3,4-dioxygenase beta subunit